MIRSLLNWRSLLALVAIGPGRRGDFVPHLTITVTLALTAADLGVLIYFIHHTAIMIQLPQVIASIAADLAEAISEQGSGNAEPHVKNGATATELVAKAEREGGVLKLRRAFRAPAHSSARHPLQ